MPDTPWPLRVETPAAAPGAAAASDPMREIVERVRAITRENERLFHQLIAGERRFRGLAKAVWKVQEEERRRLARDLHDGIGQTLTALKNQLERLELGTGVEPELRGRLAEAVEIAARALQETRELSRLLRPPVLDDLGLLPALRSLGRTLERGGLRVEIHSSGLDDERLDADLETLVFRVAQEALTNVLKHAQVEEAELSVERLGGGLRLSISDRGRGFDPEDRSGEAPGCGLRGIHDRVELFGGRSRVRSQPGQGTTIEVEVPLAPEAVEGVDR